MNIEIIAVGKLGEKYLADAAYEYIRRIGRFSRIKITEIADRPLPRNAEVSSVLESEAADILRRIRGGAYVIALCIEAAQLSSVDFARKIDHLGLSGRSELTFVIGGSFGLSPAVKARADLCLGISSMTFPHQLVRVILLEQLYRAFKINANQTYHK